MVALAVAMAALAACGQPTHDDGFLPPEEVAQQMRKLANDGEFFRAGEWQSTSRIVKLGGVSDAEAERVRETIGRQTFATCLTEDDVSEPSANFLSGEASDCNYSRFAMGDGRIVAEMRCVTGNIAQTTSLEGDYGPEHYDIKLTSLGDGPQGMDMVMEINARRIGDCAKLGPARPAPTTGGNDDEETD